jgi:hypothetical protein
MSGQFIDLIGTSNSSIQIEKAGVKIKNNSGNLAVRNPADNADAELTTSQLNNSGNTIVLNSDATESGASWNYKLTRPSSGMTANVELTLPVDDGTAGQVMATDGNGVLSFISAANTALCLKLDTTSLAFGSASPVAMFSTGAADIVDEVAVIVDTPFNGTPSLSIGVTGTTSKYMGATQVDLTAAGTTTFKVSPGLTAQGVEALIATYSAGGASAGAARIIVKYATPA